MTHIARHRKPNTAKRAVAGALVIAATTAVGVTCAGLASSAAPSVAYLKPAAYAASTLTAPQQACQAFTTWNANRTAAHLATLVVDSTKLAKSYLKADIAQLYADTSSPNSKAGKYAAKDPTYITEDCSSI